MTGIISGTYAVFLRELMLLKNKTLKLGYTFSSVFAPPVIYLTAFGLGFGSRIDVGAVAYSAFLVQGIVCMSTMTNSYNLVMTSVSFGRLYSGSFQTTITAPVSSLAIMSGLVLSGILRGFVASVFFIVIAGLLIFQVFPFTWFSLVAVILNMGFFSSLGVITGVMLKDVESNALIANFIIMPMSFFSGTFYPMDFLPIFVQKFVYLLPLSHTNIIMRAQSFSSDMLLSLTILIVLFFTVTFWLGTLLLDRYSE